MKSPLLTAMIAASVAVGVSASLGQEGRVKAWPNVRSAGRKAWPVMLKRL